MDDSMCLEHVSFHVASAKSLALFICNSYVSLILNLVFEALGHRFFEHRWLFGFLRSRHIAVSMEPSAWHRLCLYTL